MTIVARVVNNNGGLDELLDVLEERYENMTKKENIDNGQRIITLTIPDEDLDVGEEHCIYLDLIEAGCEIATG